MKVFSLLHSMKHYLAGLIFRSISDDLETAAALQRADRVRELESRAVRDREQGHVQTASLLESSASRLLGEDQTEESFGFVDAITKRADNSLALVHDSTNGNIDSAEPTPSKKRSGRRRKQDNDSNPGDESRSTS